MSLGIEFQYLEFPYLTRETLLLDEKHLLKSTLLPILFEIKSSKYLIVLSI